MSKKRQYSAAEKLAILKELEMGQATLSDVAQIYDIGLTTLRTWRHRFQLYGYESLEIRTHNKSYPAELKIQPFRTIFQGIIHRMKL